MFILLGLSRDNIWRMDEMPKYKKIDNTTKIKSNKYNIGVYSNMCIQIFVYLIIIWYKCNQNRKLGQMISLQ